MHHLTRLKALGLFTAMGLAQACANTVVYVPRTSPAEINLARYKRLAIGGIGGQDGEKVAPDLTQALMETKSFEVLDRQHLNELMKEQDFQISGRVSDDSAVSIGQIIGSSALLVGDVTDTDYAEKVTKSEEKCSKEGKLVPCTKHTRTGTAHLAIAFKLLDTESGKILAAKTVESSAGQSTSAYDIAPAPFDQREAWLAACRKNVVHDFMKVIAPYDVQVGVELLDDGDLPELEVGNNYAKMGKWLDAIAQYTAALTRAEKDPDIDMKDRAKAIYNLGVGLAYSGRYDEGIAELERAYATTAEDSYLAQIARVKQFKDDDARLAEQRASAQ
jgi:tetratricopeptide (TPR) repeat protein